MDDKTNVMRTCATMNRFRIELARDRALLDRILAVRRAVFVVERGVKRVRLDAKFEAADFYEACGYRAVSAPFMEAGIPHIKMEKKL